jgi:hypothetical protein
MSLTKEQIKALLPKHHKAYLSEDDLVGIISQAYDLDNSDNTFMVSKTGDQIRNMKSLNPVPPKEVITTFFMERKWITPQQKELIISGREERAAVTTYSQFVENWRTENPGKSDVSPEFDKAILQFTDANKDFNWNA